MNGGGNHALQKGFPRLQEPPLFSRKKKMSRSDGVPSHNATHSFLAEAESREADEAADAAVAQAIALAAAGAATTTAAAAAAAAAAEAASQAEAGRSRQNIAQNVPLPTT